jgi:mono/diheme cytochrome c family protein
MMKRLVANLADYPVSVPLLAVPAALAFLVCGLLVTARGVSADQSGADTFNATCAACHGEDGSGNTAIGKASAIPDLRSAAVQNQPDAHLADVIANGTGRMPPFKSSLTDDQIHALVLYVHGLANKK